MQISKSVVFAFLFWLLGATLEVQTGIPIPCTGEHLITVKEAPSHLRMPTKNGPSVHVNLGYLFKGCSGGEWVAYAGSGRTYFRLKEPQLKVLLASAGLKELPPAPSFLMTLSASWSAWLWIAILGFGGLGMLYKAQGKEEKTGAPEELANTMAVRAGTSTGGARMVAMAACQQAKGPARAAFGRRC